MTLRVGVVGASGYVGSELVRLLMRHPHAELRAIFGARSAGQPLKEVLPHAEGLLELSVESLNAPSAGEGLDVAFCALPHRQSAAAVQVLYERQIVPIDLSADFRLDDGQAYRNWYGAEPPDSHLSDAAVYGLVELFGDQLPDAEIISVPGCYPTASVLPLAPLVANGVISTEDIIIDAKSGVSGAGRATSLTTHFVEAAEGIRAYKVGGIHRHIPEIEQSLQRLSGSPVTVTFTPHLVPAIRGILSVCYARPHKKALKIEDIRAEAEAFYEDAPFVRVLRGRSPDTRWVRGSNACILSYDYDERTGRLIAQGAIDNLIKGAAGQAIQCMNVRWGFEETAGLSTWPMWP